MSATDIHFFLHLREQIKVYHWQTRVYARHIATDKVLKELDMLIDSYVEVYIGKYGRPRLSKETGTIVIQNMTESGIVRAVQAAARHIEMSIVKRLSREEDHNSDLLNILDEIKTHLNQLLYLFTLK
jgi:Family of unknown function (DUF5856)